MFHFGNSQATRGRTSIYWPKMGRVEVKGVSHPANGKKEKKYLARGRDDGAHESSKTERKKNRPV